MIKSKTINAGPTGLKPKGAYNNLTEYTVLDCVLHSHDSWVCTAMDAQGNPAKITGQAPYDGSPYWKALTDGGRAALAIGEGVRTDFNEWFGATANAGIRKTVADWFDTVQDAWTSWFSDTLTTGVRKIWDTWFGGVQDTWTTLENNATAAISRTDTATAGANAAAAEAQEKGSYAKQQGDAAALVDASMSGTVLTVTSRTGSTRSVDTKGEKGDKGDGIDYQTMTAAEKQALTEQVAEEIAQQGGYVLYPVEEGSLSPSSTFRKNAIISIDGVIYRAVGDTTELPLKFVVEDGKFVVQELYGHTAFVRGSDEVSADWAIWADASNDIRFRMLEDRVARLETLHQG